jgi:hypothetical protein
VIKRRILIRKDVHSVFRAFADLDFWKRTLGDVLSVRIHYQDPVNSEFSMTVARPSGPETVRGIRFCYPQNCIEMVHLIPPPAFQSMRGVWKFRPIREATLVSAERWFTLKVGGQVSMAEAGSKLSAYLQANLGLFKAALEG